MLSTEGMVTTITELLLKGHQDIDWKISVELIK